MVQTNFDPQQNTLEIAHNSKIYKEHEQKLKKGRTLSSNNNQKHQVRNNTKTMANNTTNFQSGERKQINLEQNIG